MDLKMEVYSPSLELLGLLEIHNSVMWGRKAFSAGTFSLQSLITEETLTLLQPENIIWIAGEDAGIIEYVQEEAGENGPYITVKGYNLTGILARRILWGRYDLNGPVPELMYQLVDDCCINPTRGDTEARKIPGLRLSERPIGGASIRAQKTGGGLLEALEELGETYQVSFGVRFCPEVPCMEFWAQAGVDRTIHQDANEPVFYSTELDDVLSSEYSYNSQDYRNVALVAGEGEGNDRTMVTVLGNVEAQPEPPTPPVTTKYTISLSVDPEGGGVASGGGTVESGASVTVRATPSSGFEFAGWRENGSIVSTSQTYRFTASKNRALTAVFAAIVQTFTISASIDPAGSGMVTGAGTYQEGQTVTIKAEPEEGYKFAAWQKDGQAVSESAEYTFNVTGDVELVAVFEVASRLPNGYTELEYVSTDGYARIPTGIHATIDTTRVVMDITPTEHRTTRAYFFDALNYYSSYFTYGFGLRNNESEGSMNWFSGYWGNSSGGYASFNYSFKYGERVLIDMDSISQKLKIGDKVISISPAMNTTVKDAGELNFGGYYPEDTQAYTQRMQIYSAQVYLSGELKGDFIPCKDQNENIGLFNLVDEKFYGASHGALTAGPAI